MWEFLRPRLSRSNSRSQWNRSLLRALFLQRLADPTRAKIQAIQPLATVGGGEAQLELLNFEGQLTDTCEKITHLKDPKEQVRILKQAQGHRQKLLAKVEADLQAWLLQRDDLEAGVRKCKQSVDKCALDLSVAENLTAIPGSLDFKVDQATAVLLADLQRVLQQSGFTTWSECDQRRAAVLKAVLEMAKRQADLAAKSNVG